MKLFGFFIDPYVTIVVALIVLSFFNFYSFGFFAFVGIAVGVISALFFDLLFKFFKTKSFTFSWSPIISGLIISLILHPLQFGFIALAAAAAMALKHFLRFNGLPIFNPAASGLFLIILLFSLQKFELWWGNYNLIAVAAVGIFVSIAIGRVGASLSYLLAYSLLAFLKVGVAAFSFFPFFSAFLMLVEPKTSPTALSKQIVFGVFAALTIHLLVFLQAPLPVYLLGILAANLLNRFLLSKV